MFLHVRSSNSHLKNLLVALSIVSLIFISLCLSSEIEPHQQQHQQALLNSSPGKADAQIGTVASSLADDDDDDDDDDKFYDSQDHFNEFADFIASDDDDDADDEDEDLFYDAELDFAEDEIGVCVEASKSDCKQCCEHQGFDRPFWAAEGFCECYLSHGDYSHCEDAKTDASCSQCCSKHGFQRHDQDDSGCYCSVN